jgi:hypothetical protein
MDQARRRVLAAQNDVQLVDLHFKVRTNKTGFVCRVYIQVGRRTETSVTDDARKAAIRNGIQSISFLSAPKPEMIIKWQISPNQTLVDLEFGTKYLIVDLSANLGLPAYIFNSDELEILYYEIVFRPNPNK